MLIALPWCPRVFKVKVFAVNGIIVPRNKGHVFSFGGVQVWMFHVRLPHRGQKFCSRLASAAFLPS